MAAVPLFTNTNMAVVTSREKTQKPYDLFSESLLDRIRKPAVNVK